MEPNGHPQLGAGSPQHVAGLVEDTAAGDRGRVEVHRFGVVLLDAAAHFRGSGGGVAQVNGDGMAGTGANFLDVVAQPSVVGAAEAIAVAASISGTEVVQKPTVG